MERAKSGLSPKLHSASERSPENPLTCYCSAQKVQGIFPSSLVPEKETNLALFLERLVLHLGVVPSLRRSPDPSLLHTHAHAARPCPK